MDPVRGLSTRLRNAEARMANTMTFGLITNVTSRTITVSLEVAGRNNSGGYGESTYSVTLPYIDHGSGYYSNDDRVVILSFGKVINERNAVVIGKVAR